MKKIETKRMMDNPITKSIVVAIAALWVVGALLAFAGSLLGGICIALGFGIILSGYTVLPADPYTIGLITVWGKETRFKVKGTVILANWWPFFISVIPIDMSLKELTFDVDVVSKDDVPMKGQKIIVAGVPDEDHLFEFVKAKRWEGVKMVLQGTINAQAESICSDHNCVDMAASSTTVSTPLWDVIKASVVDQKLVGYIPRLVRTDFTLPEDLVKQMIKVRSVKYEAEMRIIANRGVLKAANQSLRMAKVAGHPMTFDQAKDDVYKTDLLEQEKLTRTQYEILGSGLGRGNSFFLGGMAMGQETKQQGKGGKKP